MVLHMIEDFRAAGFKISLCYFGLRNEDESVSRVIHRVQTGGHDVADDVIRFNFHEGLKNTQQHLRLFDNLTFIDGNSDLTSSTSTNRIRGRELLLTAYYKL